MTERITIAYAYGASQTNGEEQEGYFRDNITRPFDWQVVPWRDCLHSPEAARIDTLAARFDGPIRPDPALGEEGIEIDDIETDDSERWVTLEVEAAGAESRGLIGDAFRIVVDRKGFIRDAYRTGIRQVGPTVADVLNYLSNRSDVTDCVVDKLARLIHTAPGRVAFVGESLGGMLVVDALARMKQDKSPLLDKVCIVITFASQSAARLELRPGGSDVDLDPFLPWANIWHRDDLLSYPIRRSLEAYGSRIRDHEARHPTLFPTVHDTYITDPRSRLFDFINYEIALECDRDG